MKNFYATPYQVDCSTKSLDDGASSLSIQLRDRISFIEANKRAEENNSVTGVSLTIANVEDEAKKILHNLEIQKAKRILMRKIDLHMLPILAYVI